MTRCKRIMVFFQIRKMVCSTMFDNIIYFGNVSYFLFQDKFKLLLQNRIYRCSFAAKDFLSCNFVSLEGEEQDEI